MHIEPRGGRWWSSAACCYGVGGDDARCLFMVVVAVMASGWRRRTFNNDFLELRMEKKNEWPDRTRVTLEAAATPLGQRLRRTNGGSVSRIGAGSGVGQGYKKLSGIQPLPVIMKAMVVSPLGGRVPPDHRGVLHNGLGIGGTRRDLEAEEVAAYLTKLRSLVPDMPRKRKLSKLEVIQRVIEYICDLQTALEETNAVTHQDMTSTTTTTTTQSSRQPLLNAITTTATTTAPTIATSVVMTTTTSSTVAER